MALRSGLALYAYTLAPSAPQVVAEYADVVEALEFTTVAPGGFGDLACVVKLADARIPRPELGLFGRVVLKDGFFTCFSGEWHDPALVLDGQHGDHVLLSALGGGVALRDDPDESAYTNQTAQSIVSQEFSKRGSYLALDPDQSLVLPSAPASVFSPAYDGYNLEEICHDLAFSLGDYTWAAWDHTRNKDAAGFPTWQLQMHARDLSTTHYMALGEDIVSWRVAPSAQRAFNVVEVAYVDPVNGPGKVSVQDSRLAANGSQNTAPFRRRKLRRALGRVPLTAAQATTIAQAWLTAYQNITNKVEVVLRAVRDVNGNPVPLHMVRADKNLFVPELAVRGQTLPVGPSVGINQFYIVESAYKEIASGDVTLTLQLDNYADKAGSLLAQLKLAYDAALRARGTVRPTVGPGMLYVGPAGAAFSNCAAGDTVKVVVPFGITLAKTPSSITLSGAGVNFSNLNANTYTQTGFTLQWQVPVSGATSWIGTFTTHP